MPTGQIEIFEFSGTVEEATKEQVQTYLLLIDGECSKKYRRPKFEYLPKSWRKKYQTATFDVGRSTSWKEFYESCGSQFEDGASGQEVVSSRQNSEPSEVAEPVSDNYPQPTPSDSSNESLVQASTPPTLEPAIRELFEGFLDDPPEREQSLRFEVKGYLFLLRDEAELSAAVNVSLAEAIAENLLELLSQVSEPGYSEESHFLLVQAGIRYFTVAEDAVSDFEEGGLDDDVQVLNYVAQQVGRADLIIDLQTVSSTGE